MNPEIDQHTRVSRRTFAIAVASASVLGLVACDTDKRPDAFATLNNNDDIQAALKTLDDAIDSLENDVGRFDDEDWKDVVPDVQTSSTDVRDAFDSLQKTLGVDNN